MQTGTRKTGSKKSLCGEWTARTTVKEKFNYKIDSLMSRGTVALVALLASITIGIVALAGVAAMVIDTGWADGRIGQAIWNSLVLTLDAGNLAGVEGSAGLIAIAAIVTLCGIFITSTLIGIINTGLQSRLERLRKGTSKVIESGHTVILGFNEKIFTILTELIIANESERKSCIVIMGSEEKSDMEDHIAGKISGTKKTRIICRSGDTSSYEDLKKCSIETCKSVIVNEETDLMVIKSILAASNYLEDFIFAGNNNCKAFITAMVNDAEDLEAARIAGQGFAEILYFRDTVSKLIAHTCFQPGLSDVFMDLFGFEGNEIYFERFNELSGEKFSSILNRFEDSTVIGIRKGAKVFLNPAMDTVIEENDDIIVIAQDNDMAKPTRKEEADLSVEIKDEVNNSENSSNFDQEHNLKATHGFVNELSLKSAEGKGRLLILGINPFLESIIRELDVFVKGGAEVVIAHDAVHEAGDMPDLGIVVGNIKIRIEECMVSNRRVLEKLTSEPYDHILILSDSGFDAGTADARTLLLLIHLRDIALKRGVTFNITSEMMNVRNQELAQIADVSDFIVSSNITSRMIAQISENRYLAPVFDELLSCEGSELYLKPAGKYIPAGQEVDIMETVNAAAKNGEVFIGYRKKVNGSTDLADVGMVTAGRMKKFKTVINPPKSARLTFGKEDSLIVLAEDFGGDCL